jgi:hypothetical protein
MAAVGVAVTGAVVTGAAGMAVTEAVVTGVSRSRVGARDSEKALA